MFGLEFILTNLLAGFFMGLPRGLKEGSDKRERVKIEAGEQTEA